MRRLLLIGICVMLTMLVSCESSQPAPAVPAPAPAPAAEPLPAPEPSQPQVTNVHIIRYAFYPQAIEIARGDKVRWVNEDGTSHSIKLLGAPPSPILSPGQTYEMTFTEQGTFQYSCGIHAKMQGAIIVR